MPWGMAFTAALYVCAVVVCIAGSVTGAAMTFGSDGGGGFGWRIRAVGFVLMVVCGVSAMTMLLHVLGPPVHQRPTAEAAP